MIDGGRVDFAKDSEFFQKIQSKSIHFINSITYAPYTNAAMHAIFSGTYGNRTGTNSYWSTYSFKKEKFKTLTEYLAAENYYTCADIVSELIIPQQGFNEFLVHNEENDDLISKHCNLLELMKDKNEQGTNFFLYLHYSKIHVNIKKEVLQVYSNFSKEYFDNFETNRNRYIKLFTTAENYLKKIFEKITTLNLMDDSLVLIISDHGISIGEKMGERAYGAFCYDYTLKTLCYFLIPNLQPKNIITQIRSIDYMPTILDLLKIKFDQNFEKIDGKSLLPLINDKKNSEEIAFSETGNPGTDDRPSEEPNVKSIRTSDWKFISNEHNNTEELYNLKIDPNEKNNIICEDIEIKELLKKKLDSFQKK
tara:strand:- start:1174 stop:2268 length:1095 start_codon:yes stop_codon:yes gene_type:complete